MKKIKIQVFLIFVGIFTMILTLSGCINNDETDLFVGVSLSPKSYNENDFIVIDIEDIVRLEKYKINFSEKMYERMNEQILKDIDLFISHCLKEINLENTRLIQSNIRKYSY